MRVENLTSNKGNKVANQFKVVDGNAVYFQSYDSLIVKIEGNDTYLDRRYWNYSKTTSKYRSLFLGETTKETEQKIKNGEYCLTDLN